MYSVLNKTVTGTSVLMILENAQERRKRDVQAEKPLIDLPEKLYVRISLEDHTVNLKV